MQQKVIILSQVQEAALVNLINIAVERFGTQCLGVLIDIIKPALQGATEEQIITYANSLKPSTKK